MKHFNRIIATFLIFNLCAQQSLASIWFVDSDQDDGSSTCVANESVNDNDCTLRDAFSKAASGDFVRFLKDLTIRPTDTLTVQTQNLNLDAAQTGYAYNVVLDGSNTTDKTGLSVQANGVTINGLKLINWKDGVSAVNSNNFTFTNNHVGNNSGDGVKISGGDRHTVSNNYIGIDATGADTTWGNGGNGINVEGNATGFNVLNGNKIGANGANGIKIKLDATATGTEFMQGNQIGKVTPAATNAGNNGYGIFVESGENMDFTIGVLGDNFNDSTEGNVIAGQVNEGGIAIQSGRNVMISGNKVGVDTTGNTVIPNGDANDDALDINSRVMIIGTNNNGTSDSLEGNVFSAHGGAGIKVDSTLAQNIRINGNVIGGNASGLGSTDFGNDGAGISINAAALQQLQIGEVGQTNVADGRNVIVNNGKGIDVQGVGNSATVNIYNNYIGVGSDGKTAMANGLDAGDNISEDAGIKIDTIVGRILKAVIGTNGDGVNDANEGNIIANSEGDAVRLGIGINSAVIAGNKIGAVKNGGTLFTGDGGNKGNGVYVNSTDSLFASVVIGGDLPVEGNVIGANDKNAIHIEKAAGTTKASVQVRNNIVGFGSDGETSLGNTAYSLWVQEANDLLIADNIISNSGDDAVVVNGGRYLNMLGNNIGGNYKGDLALGNNGYGVRIDAPTLSGINIGSTGAGSGNTIVGSGLTKLAAGLQISAVGAGSFNAIQGNYIGVCANPKTGAVAADQSRCGNSGSGVVTSTGSITIGGDNGFGEDGKGSLGGGNIISNNVRYGIELSGTVTSALIAGNIIGLTRSADGSIDIAAGNKSGGVYVDSTSLADLKVGHYGSGLAYSRRNVISANVGHGVDIKNMAKVAGISFFNNYIGTGWLGKKAFGNTGSGIYFGNPSGQTLTASIGGYSSDQANVISGNTGDGINFGQTATLTATIVNNIIGLGKTGTENVGNEGSGIQINSSSATVNVGAANGRNIIAGNKQSGITLTKGKAMIKNNYLGVGSDGKTIFANSLYAINAMAGDSKNLVIGGSSASDKNLIENNSGVAINLQDIAPFNKSTLTASNNWTNTGTAPFRFWEYYVNGVLSEFAPLDGKSNADKVVVPETTEEETTTEEQEEESSTTEEPASTEEETVIEGEPEVTAPSTEETETVTSTTNTSANQQRVTEVVNQTLETISTALVTRTIDDLEDLIVDYETRVESSRTEEVPTAEKQVIDQFIDVIELTAADQLTPEVSEVVESAGAIVTANIKESVDTLIKEQNLEEISVSNFGNDIKVNDQTEFFFSTQAEEAEKVQTEAVENGENKVVLTTFSDLDENGVADLLQVREGAKIFAAEKVSADEKFFFGSNLAEEVDKVEEIIPENPTITNLPDEEVEVGSELTLWVAGQKLGEEYEVFLIDLNSDGEKIDPRNTVKKNVNGFIQYFVGSGKIEEGNKSIFTVNFNDPNLDIDFAGNKKEFYLIIKNNDGETDVSKVVVNPEQEVEIDASLEGVEILSGYGEAGAQVVVAWQSVVFSSVVLADAQGYYEVKVPKKLEAGDHRAYVYLYNDKKKVISKTNSLVFKK